MEQKVVLITGSTGLVGRELTAKLLAKGHRVHALTRRKAGGLTSHHALKWFYWDVSKNVLDPACLDGVTDIVHLAGESIGGGRWTARRRELIRSSRIASIRLLYVLLSGREEHEIGTVVSASATGIYVPNLQTLLDESAPESPMFLGRTCVDWEEAVTEGAQSLGLRAVCFRSGVVLSKQGGMYAQLRPTVRMGLGVVPGTGKQWLPWIHVEDAVGAYLYALETPEMKGAYNLVAPEQATMGVFMHKMARALRRKIWIPPVPSLMIRLGLGRMSTLLLDSMQVSSAKLQASGFTFKYPHLAQALHNLEGNA